LEETLIKQFLEAGVHFGHQTKRWNPKMGRFVFGEKGGIHIIDLQKTAQYLEKAQNFLEEVAGNGGYILFVGTKKQAQKIIEEEAKRCFMFYVNYRWLGGTLTNFQTVRRSVEKLKSLREKKQEAETEKMSKKELARLNQELEKLQKNLVGIEGMEELPSAIFVVDSKREEIAIREANKLGIPVVALVDTNCDPEKIDYPIPGNDDAIRSIKLIASLIAESILEGRDKFIKEARVKEAKVEKQKAASAKSAKGVTGEDEEELIEKEAKKKLGKKKIEEEDIKTKTKRSHY
jgi:small subunit ribosomal protein S2